MDFIARLVALVPKPRVNLTRFRGVFAPNSAHGAQVTPAKRASASDCFDHSAQIASVHRERLVLVGGLTISAHHRGLGWGVDERLDSTESVFTQQINRARSDFNVPLLRLRKN
jgi:hypothetical protein